MSEEERENIIVLVDEQGEELKFEVLDIIEYKENEYAVGVEADLPEDEEDSSVLIMRIVHANDEEDILEPINDEKELNAVFEIFKDHMDDEFEFED